MVKEVNLHINIMQSYWPEYLNSWLYLYIDVILRRNIKVKLIILYESNKRWFGMGNTYEKSIFQAI